MHLFTRLPISVSGPLPVIPDADITYLTGYEPDSYDHWVFDSGSANSLVGLNRQRPLTAQAPGAIVYSDRYLTLSSAVGNGLMSGLEDVAQAKYTMCAVVREPAPQGTGVKTIFGTYAAANNQTVLSVASPNRKAYVNYSGLPQAAMEPVVAAGTWYFVATSLDFGPGTSSAHSLKSMVGGSSPVSLAGTGAHTPSGLKLTLGNGWYGAGAAGTLQFAEFILYDRALSAAELQAVYVRSKGRMAASGITVT